MSLDGDIAAWAATVRLSDAEADDIVGRIVQTPVRSPEQPPRLDPSWWRGFTADFAARMVASTRPVRRAA
jgi:hypothetical protein